ncbi:SnoaL-like polyketide cyclase [Leptospira meyeri]|uniref:SnoaL-like polyketide cyclase n=1 Tax=Leptospira meyeri TaxID=29508 RepID=A0A4R8MX71_LEPME|nr:ester cyclase [Leptospira meyeri]EKJ85532.1 SnoaL-like polyketide cyclase [Leptospira meyeri serovar Hardjo str. Went 5]TDY72032.1 SnoaL-like polyketide cyclase [Leptospira meyeri]TGL47686.1 ester cyclase [Leptospira meyeri]
MDVLEKNKHIVKRFNEEVIQNCNEVTFRELMHVDFINRSAPEHANDSNAMWNTFNSVLKPAFPDLTVEIFDQVAEGDKVTTRKAITGTHKGVLMGIAPTQQKIRIDVIDIVRLQDGKYIEHWGINTLQTVLTDLRSK